MNVSEKIPFPKDSFSEPSRTKNTTERDLSAGTRFTSAIETLTQESFKVIFRRFPLKVKITFKSIITLEMSILHLFHRAFF